MVFVFLFLTYLLSMITSGSIQIAADGIIFSFLWLSNIPLCVCVCVCVCVFIHSFIDGHLGCFLLLTIVYTADRYTWVHAFFFKLEFSSFPDTCTGATLLDQMVTQFLVF